MKATLVSLSILIMIVSAATFVLLAQRTYVYTLDDSFISFRYASHLANGNGLVWNIDEKFPNEGYTSILWVTVLALAQRSGLDIVTASKLMGIIFTLLTAGICFWSVYRLSAPSFPARVRLLAGTAAAALFMTNIHLFAHVTSGMETSISMFFITLFFVSVVSYTMPPGPGISKTFIIGLLALLSGLSRPEFNLTAVVTLLTLVYISAPQRKFAAYGLALYTACGLAYFAWRYNYFGLLLPLPFYIKQLGAHTSHFPGLHVVLGFIKSLWPLYLFGGLFAVSLQKENRIWLPVLIGVASNIIYFILPEHIMGGNYRFLFPVYPALAIFAGLGMLSLWNISRNRVYIYAAVTVAVLLLFCLRQARNYSIIDNVRGYAVSLNNVHIALGTMLAGIDPSGKSVLAIGDAGAAPYYSKWDTVDTFGLNNREIAQMRSKHSYDAAAILSKHMPDVLVLISFDRDKFNPHLPYEKPLYDESLKLNYRAAGTLQFNKDEYYLWVMAKDPSLFDNISRLLSKHGY